MEKNNTLERLLRIQGQPKQITFDAAMKEVRAPAPVQPGAMNQPSDQRGNGEGKISPAEREAWGSLYRFYEKYAPQLRAAARLDDENDEAARIFQTAAAEMNDLYKDRGIIGKTLSIPLYDLLREVFKDARERNTLSL